MGTSTAGWSSVRQNLRNKGQCSGEPVLRLHQVVANHSADWRAMSKASGAPFRQLHVQASCQRWEHLPELRCWRGTLGSSPVRLVVCVQHQLQVGDLLAECLGQMDHHVSIDDQLALVPAVHTQEFTGRVEGVVR